MSFIEMLFRRDTLPPPPLGIGRICRFDDEDAIPSQEDRFREILSAVRDGSSSLTTISNALSFKAPKAMIQGDCDDLVARGVFVGGGGDGRAPRYFMRRDISGALS